VIVAEGRHMTESTNVEIETFKEPNPKDGNAVAAGSSVLNCRWSFVAVSRFKLGFGFDATICMPKVTAGGDLSWVAFMGMSDGV
jgi:hypothetical protein